MNADQTRVFMESEMRDLESRLSRRLEENAPEHTVLMRKLDADPSMEAIVEHFHKLAEDVLDAYAEFESRFVFLQSAVASLPMDTQPDPLASAQARARMYPEVEELLSRLRRQMVGYTATARSLRIEENATPEPTGPAS